MAVESIEQYRVGAGKLVGLIQILAPALERLFAEHRAPITFHRRIVGGYELRRDHAFQLIPRPNADQGTYYSVALQSDFIGVGITQPYRLARLVCENVIPVIGH